MQGDEFEPISGVESAKDVDLRSTEITLAVEQNYIFWVLCVHRGLEEVDGNWLDESKSKIDLFD